MTEKIIIAGSGGQGVMLLGKVLAEAAMRENKYVTWLPSYGAEVRGGTAYCMVVVSDKDIGSPYVDKADALIVMNNPSLVRFRARLKNKGLLIINTSLADSSVRQALKHPFSGLAVKIGNVKVANMIILGFYLAQRKTVSLTTVLKVIEEIAPADKKELVAINQRALNEGYKLNG
ncbi:MAG: 2-oxoacid:acceptor oxidoreductase family protein [Candidatus Omnitrophota bacterium]